MPLSESEPEMRRSIKASIIFVNYEDGKLRLCL